jgi:hypothetical protein
MPRPWQLSLKGEPSLVPGEKAIDWVASQKLLSFLFAIEK